MSRISIILLSLLAAGIIIGGAAWYRYTHPIAVTIPVTRPATATVSATAPASAPVVAKPPTTQLLDVVRANHPRYPATRALDDAVDLKYAGRIILQEPVYLDQQGRLWITRADAPPKIDFAKAVQSPSATHVIRERAAFVLWSLIETGIWLPQLVVHNDEQGGYDLLDSTGRRHLDDPLGFDWDRAVVLQASRGQKNRIVVPTRTGVCAFAFDDAPEQILKAHHALIASDARAATRAKPGKIQLIMDLRGVIAWVTDPTGTQGARGAARLAPFAAAGPNQITQTEYRWTTLTGAAGWPDGILHIVPLLDGSVLQIVSGDEPDKVSFSLNSVEAAAVDEDAVLKLVDQLSSTSREKRDQAFKQLTQYGPGIAPILEKSMREQSPEARVRLRQLLKNKIEPSLGGMSLIDSKMRLMARFPDGGVLFYSEAGVSIPRPDDQPLYVTPAWLAIRPGRAVELLPESLSAEVTPEKQTIAAWASHYVVTDRLLGPQWFLGNRLEPLLRKSERHFNQFAGIDAAGRWLFRQSPEEAARRIETDTEKPEHKGQQDLAPQTRPATPQTNPQSTIGNRQSASRNPTLILDPRLPDVTPRMPVWNLPVSAGKVGWDAKGWPVIYMDAQPKPVPWALEAAGWRAMDEAKEKVLTDPAQLPAPPPFVPKRVILSKTTTPSTLPAITQAATTRSTTTQSTEPVEIAEPGPVLLVDPAQNRYYDGRETLTVIRADGSRLDFKLPDQAAGGATARLVRTRDGLIFLFNAPGRVVRLAPVADGPEPFEVQAVFTRGIPNDPNPLRIWVDPAQRICIAHNNNEITVLFPDGRIPPPIAEKMPIEQMGEDD